MQPSRTFGSNCLIPLKKSLSLAALTLLLSLLPATPSLDAQSTFEYRNKLTVAEQYLFAAANEARANQGLPPLRLDPVLSEASALHAREMADHDAISHQFDGEPELATRAANTGAHFSLIAENVGEAPTSPIIHDLWMHSPHHRENLLDPNVDSIGIAIVTRNNQLYAVEDFAKPSRSSPSTSRKAPSPASSNKLAYASQKPLKRRAKPAQ